MGPRQAAPRGLLCLGKCLPVLQSLPWYTMVTNRSASHHPDAFTWDPDPAKEKPVYWKNPNYRPFQWVRTHGRFKPLAFSEKSGIPLPTSQPWYDLVQEKHERVAWHRSVVRFPAGLHSQMFDNILLISGRAGIVRLDLDKLDPTGLVALKYVKFDESSSGEAPGNAPSAMMMLASPKDDPFKAIVNKVESSIRGAAQGFLVGLVVKGVGYRMEPVEPEAVAQLRLGKWGGGGYIFDKERLAPSNHTYPISKPATAIRLKVGFSNTIVYPLPHDMRALFPKPTVMYLYGMDKERLDRVAAHIRSLRKPNIFTGNGIALMTETVKLKERRKKK